MALQELNKQLFDALNETEVSPSKIQQLLQAGAEVNAVDEEGNTPLLRACSRYSHVPPAVAELLLEAGAGVDAVSPRGMTPLARAVIKEDAELVALLLRQAEPEKVFGQSAACCLLEAVARDNAEVAKLLLCANVLLYALPVETLGDNDDELTDEQVSDYILRFLEYSFLGVDDERYIVEDSTLRLIDKALRLALEYEVSRELLELLLEFGADVNAYMDDSSTVFSSVVESLARVSDDDDAQHHSDELSLIQFLLLEGADPFKKKIKPSAFEYAVYENDIQFLDLFLPETMDMAQINQRCGYIVFTRALRFINSPDIVRLFLSRGADVHARDAEGKTPLVIAVERTALTSLYKGTGFRRLRESNLGIVRCLLAAGADVNLVSGGVFPMASEELASPGAGVATLQAFAEATKQPESCVTALAVAVYYADVVCVELLLAAGANPSIQACGYSPMQLASALRNPACRHSLLSSYS